MKFLNLFAFLGVLLSCASCARVFAPAMYLHEDTYMQKPYLDSAETHKQGTYVSLKASTTTQAINEHNSPNIFCGILQLHQAHSFTNFNIAYGIQAAAGNVVVPEPADYNGILQYSRNEVGNKLFQGVGARFEANVKAPSSNPFLEWRVLGVSYNHSIEFGDYYAFRQRLMPAEQLAYSRGNQMFSVGINTEFCWRMGKQNPANRGYAVNFKLGYLYSKFLDFVEEPIPTSTDPVRHDRTNNIAFSLVGDFKDFQIIYQTISPLKTPVPVLVGISQSIQVGLNLSALTKKRK